MQTRRIKLNITTPDFNIYLQNSLDSVSRKYYMNVNYFSFITPEKIWIDFDEKGLNIALTNPDLVRMYFKQVLKCNVTYNKLLNRFVVSSSETTFQLSKYLQKLIGSDSETLSDGVQTNQPDYQQPFRIQLRCNLIQSNGIPYFSILDEYNTWAPLSKVSLKTATPIEIDQVALRNVKFWLVDENDRQLDITPEMKCFIEIDIMTEPTPIYDSKFNYANYDNEFREEPEFTKEDLEINEEVIEYQAQYEEWVSMHGEDPEISNILESDEITVPGSDAQWFFTKVISKLFGKTRAPSDSIPPLLEPSSKKFTTVPLIAPATRHESDSTLDSYLDNIDKQRL